MKQVGEEIILTAKGEKKPSKLLLHERAQAWKAFEEHYNAIYQILLENVSRETDRNQAHIKLRELYFWTDHHLQLRDK